MKTDMITRYVAPRTRAESPFAPPTGAIAPWQLGTTASDFGHIGTTASDFGHIGNAANACMVTGTTPAPLADARVTTKQARPPRGVPR